MVYSALFTLPGIVTSEPFDFDFASLEMVTWIYASQDVGVTTGESGCMMRGDTVHVELDLKAGWNYVGISFEEDPDDEEAAIVYVYLIDPAEIHVFPPVT